MRTTGLVGVIGTAHRAFIGRDDTWCVRVLVVEDEAKMAKLISRGLAEEGHAVDVAGRGEDALWMAQAAAYDAIILDVMLPGLDGFETSRELRR